MSPILGSIGGASEYPFRGNLDDIPVNIVLSNLSNIEPGSVGIATTIITGLNYQALVDVTNGAETSVNGAPYDSLPKTIRNNQSLSVRFNTTSGADRDFSKVYTTLLTVGRKKTNWSVTTRAKDNTPSSYSFTNSTNQNVGVLTSSNIITISGLDASLPSAFAFISSGIGSFSINGVSGFTTSRVSVGDTIRIETYTPDSYSTTKVVGFTVGTFTTTFTVSTRIADTTVNSFAFTPLTDADINETHTSNTITLSGADNNVVLPVSISGSSGEYSVNSSPYISAGSNALNGNTISVRIPSSSVVAYATTYRTTLNVSGVAGTFSVTTRPRPIISYPTQFTFNDLITAPPEIISESNIITLAGITTGDFGTASISGDGAEFKVIRNNVVVRNYSSISTSVTLGDQIQLRLTAPSPLQTIQTRFNVTGQNTTNLPGFNQSTSDIWSVTSRDFICSPLVEGNFFVSPRFKNIESAEIKTLYNTLVDFSSVYDSKCGFAISTSNPDSYIENPYTGESDNEVLVPELPSQGIKVWMKSPDTYDTFKETTITISNTKNPEPTNILRKNWSILTRLEDKTPNTFYLSTRNIAKADPNTIYSTYVTESLSGLTNETLVTATVTSTNGTALISKNNGPFSTTINDVKNGDRIDIKVTSSALDQSVTSTVTIGNLSETWLVSTINSVPVISLSILPSGGTSEYQKTLLYENRTGIGVIEKVEQLSQTLPWNAPIKLFWTFSYMENAILVLPYVTPGSPNNFAIQNVSDYIYNYASQASLNAAGQISAGIQPNADGSTDLYFAIRASNTTGVSTSIVIAKIAPPPPSVFIQSTPTGTIPYDTNYTITWASVYASSVDSTINLNNTQNLSSSLVFNNAKQTTTHSISVKNVTGIGSTSITINIPPCSTLVKETDYATFYQTRSINSNGTESALDYYLYSIKNNQNNVPYGYTTIGGAYTYQTIISTIVDRYMYILQRPPTLSEVEDWLAKYQRGIGGYVPCSFTFGFSGVTNDVNKYYRPKGYISGPGFGVVLDGANVSQSGNLLSGASYTITIQNCILSTARRSSTTILGDWLYEFYGPTLGNTGPRYDLDYNDAFLDAAGGYLQVSQNSATFIPSGPDPLRSLTDSLNSTLTTPSILFTKFVDRCRANIPPIFLFTSSKVLSLYGGTASGTGTFSGKTGVVGEPGSIAEVQSSYRFDKILNNFILELKIDSTWGLQSGFVGLCNDAHWNAGPNFSSSAGKRAMYFIGSNTNFGSRTGTTIQTFVSSLSTEGLFAQNDILGMVFNNKIGKLAIYKNGTLLLILTNSALIASTTSYSSAPLYPVVSYYQKDISLDSTILQTPSTYSSNYVFPV